MLKACCYFDLKTAQLEEDEEIYDEPPEEEGMFGQYFLCVIKERHKIMHDTEAALMATKTSFFLKAKWRTQFLTRTFLFALPLGG